MPVTLTLDQIITSRLSLAVLLYDDYKRVGKVVGMSNVTIQELNLAAVENLSGYHNFLDLTAGAYTIKVNAESYIEEEVVGFTIPRTTAYSLPIGGWIPTGSREATLLSINGLRDGDVLEFNNGSDLPERRTITIDPDPATRIVHWDNDSSGGLTYEYTFTDSIKIPHPENLIIRVRLKPNPLYPFPSSATLVRGSIHDTDGNPLSKAIVEVAGGILTTRTAKNGDFVLYFPASQEDEQIQIAVTPFTSGGQPLPTLTVNGEIQKGRSTSVAIAYP